MIRDLSPASRAFSSGVGLGAAVQEFEVEERRKISNMLSLEQIQKMEFYSKFTPTSVSLSHFLDHGADGKGVDKSYLFLRREIPVRLANIMMELEVRKFT
jgi:hypothetical protein